MEKEKSLCEEKVFTSVFQEYATTLHNYLYYKTGNTDLSQDLTQEAFTRLWKNCSKVIFSTSKNYVFTIANNLLLNQYKHNKVVLQHEQKNISDRDVENPEFLMEEQELKDRIEKAIANLSEKQRIVFLMSRIEKKKYKEIAEILGISKKAVEKRMYLALNELRKVCARIK